LAVGLGIDQAEGGGRDLHDAARAGQAGERLQDVGVDLRTLYDQVHAGTPRLASASRSTPAALRIISSVVSQPTQASVTEQPYLSCERSAGIDWLPASMKLSIIRPTTERLPSRIWWI